jgi:hypothetical protein
MQRMIDFLDHYSWNALINSIDSGSISVDDASTDFIHVLHFVLDSVVGYHTVSLRNKEPPHITPYIKILLKRRNRLIRKGRTAKAILTKSIESADFRPISVTSNLQG